jgi:putative two-component system response regulator
MPYKILAVDDVQINIDMLEEILKNDYEFFSASSGMQALSLIERLNPDLVLLDLSMPGMNGFEVLRRMHGNPKFEHIPVIIVTAEDNITSEEKGLDLGAADYIRKPFQPKVIQIKIRNHLALKTYQDNLADMVSERTKQLFAYHEAIIMGMSLLSESRDGTTGSHIARIKEQTRLLTNKINELHPAVLDKEMAALITTYAPLHDVGKVGVPDSILLKTGGLTREEFDLMKSHTWRGGDLLRNIVDFLEAENQKQLKVAIDIAEGHHERFDGTGYPDGLTGEEIPLAARIVALPDVYDALRSTRQYKKGFSHEEATEIILNGDGRTDPRHFDPIVLEAFRLVQREMAESFDANPDLHVMHN